jgi:hypothetical protein
VLVRQRLTSSRTLADHAARRLTYTGGRSALPAAAVVATDGHGNVAGVRKGSAGLIGSGRGPWVCRADRIAVGAREDPTIVVRQIHAGRARSCVVVAGVPHQFPNLHDPSLDHTASALVAHVTVEPAAVLARRHGLSRSHVHGRGQAGRYDRSRRPTLFQCVPVSSNLQIGKSDRRPSTASEWATDKDTRVLASIPTAGAAVVRHGFDPGRCIPPRAGGRPRAGSRP